MMTAKSSVFQSLPPEEITPDELDAGEKALILAQAAECAQRYDDMVEYMRERVQVGGNLHAMERELLSVAYKGALQQRRTAVRELSAVETQEAASGHEAEASMAASYRSKVETELLDLCSEATALLKDELLPKAEVGEPKAFYLKMQADFYRYTTEFAGARAAREEATTAATLAYEAAMREAKHHLLTTHPVRLALALNFSVFQQEALHDCAAAIATAEVGLSELLQDLEGMPEETFAEVHHTMQMLQDNLALWRSRPEARSPRMSPRGMSPRSPTGLSRRNSALRG